MSYKDDMASIRSSASSAAEANWAAARAAQDSARAQQKTALSAEKMARHTSGIAIQQSLQTVIQAKRALEQREHDERVERELREHHLAMERKADEHHFSLWRQTRDGQDYMQWSAAAERFLDWHITADALWFEAWRRAILTARDLIPEDEKRRFQEYSSRCQQKTLHTIARVFFAGAITWLTHFLIIPIALIFVMIKFRGEARRKWLVAGFVGTLLGGAIGLVLDKILFIVGNFCGYYSFSCPKAVINPSMSEWWFIVAGVLGALGGLLYVVAKKKQKKALTDPTVQQEQQARFEKFGFDPLSLEGPAFYWSTSDYQKVQSDLKQLEYWIGEGRYTSPSLNQLPSVDPKHYAPVIDQSYVSYVNAEQVASAFHALQARQQTLLR